MYEMNDEFNTMVALIKSREFHKAYNLIVEAIKNNVENAALYNLLGAIEESKGDRLKAGKFYRVAYYMDQTFAPASDNLSRVTDFFYTKRIIDYGVNFENEEK